MRYLSLVSSVAAVAALGGCVAYPVYQPAPVARLTPAQSAALAAQPVDPAERERLSRLNADLARQDQAEINAQAAYAAQPYYVYPAAPYYGYGYGYGYGYPYYYPWVPGLSLSLGFSRGWGGYRGGHRGGWHGGGRWHR